MNAALIAEMMKNFAAIEANVRAAYPDASEEKVYQITKAAMNASLSI
jgi:hypothetical protein